MSLCDLDAVTVRGLLGRKAVSATEVVQAAIERIEAIDGAVNALPTRDFERALAAARAADGRIRRGEALGALEGLPIAVKDLEETAGLRTTFGSLLFRDHVPARDHSMVAAIRAAGGIVLAKSNTPEFGAGANTRNLVFGATGNPFDTTRTAAGSSGGSAVALATGMVALATGSDMGGSLRNPAAYCGIVGFRPTPGLVPNEKKLLGWAGLGVLGPMARTVADLRLLLGVIAGDDAADPLATTVPGRRIRHPGAFAAEAADLASLRAAVTPDFGFAPTDRHVRAVFAERCARMAPAFSAFEEATPDCGGSDDCFAVLRGLSFLAGFKDMVARTPELVGPNVRANVAEALRLDAAAVADAMKHQTVLYRRWLAFFERHDVLISPMMTIAPRPWAELYPAEIDGVPTRSYYHWLALAYAVTLVGHPAVTIPCGVDRDGMPFGIQLVGPRGADARLLAIAEALERHLAAEADTARPLPDLARLASAPPIAASPGFLEMG
ncbi:amidase [Prosthecomicrobium sp. N25]|uniref:amidase n=1 Tax=Prosthecomicrobium sp. N25 TaxID=3129254 RepID=UPI0030775C22